MRIRTLEAIEKKQKELISMFIKELKQEMYENMGDKYIRCFEEFIGSQWEYSYSDRQIIFDWQRELFDIVTK